MDQLKEVAKKAGMDDSQCEAATSGILSVLKKNLSEDQFKMIEDKIPGATASAEAQDRGASASLGGGMGGMFGGAMSALGGGGNGDGGGATDVAGLTAMLASKGVDTSMISKYLPQITDFLQSKGIDVSSVLGGGGGGEAAGGGGLGGLAGMASGFKF